MAIALTERHITDSALVNAAAIRQNPEMSCPVSIVKTLTVIEPAYYSTDGILHFGQLVIDQRLAREVLQIFQQIKEKHFPIACVIPAAHPRFAWNDDLLMEHNVTSCFNYRTIAGSEKISCHAFGRAIDINPLWNPWTSPNGNTKPPGAMWDPLQPGTITEDSFLVKLFESLGWEWGGRWKDPFDPQHFQKPLLLDR